MRASPFLFLFLALVGSANALTIYCKDETTLEAINSFAVKIYYNGTEHYFSTTGGSITHNFNFPYADIEVFYNNLKMRRYEGVANDSTFTAYIPSKNYQQTTVNFYDAGTGESIAANFVLKLNNRVVENATGKTIILYTDPGVVYSVEISAQGKGNIYTTDNFYNQKNYFLRDEKYTFTSSCLDLELFLPTFFHVRDTFKPCYSMRVWCNNVSIESASYSFECHPYCSDDANATIYSLSDTTTAEGRHCFNTTLHFTNTSYVIVNFSYTLSNGQNGTVDRNISVVNETINPKSDTAFFLGLLGFSEQDAEKLGNFVALFFSIVGAGFVKKITKLPAPPMFGAFSMLFFLLGIMQSKLLLIVCIALSLLMSFWRWEK